MFARLFFGTQEAFAIFHGASRLQAWRFQPPSKALRFRYGTPKTPIHLPGTSLAISGREFGVVNSGSRTRETAIMIRLHEITGKEDLLEAFVAHYARAGGFPLDIDYVRRCRTFAFMNGATAMAGGFLINVAPPFRSLNDMPENERDRILALLDLDETFEAMCFWFARDMRGTFKMMSIWAELLLFLQRSSPRFARVHRIEIALAAIQRRADFDSLRRSNRHASRIARQIRFFEPREKRIRPRYRA
jgi:hypothetical protein